MKQEQLDQIIQGWASFRQEWIDLAALDFVTYSFVKTPSGYSISQIRDVIEFHDARFESNLWDLRSCAGGASPPLNLKSLSLPELIRSFYATKDKGFRDATQIVAEGRYHFAYREEGSELATVVCPDIECNLILVRGYYIRVLELMCQCENCRENGSYDEYQQKLGEIKVYRDLIKSTLSSYSGSTFPLVIAKMLFSSVIAQKIAG